MRRLSRDNERSFRAVHHLHRKSFGVLRWVLGQAVKLVVRSAGSETEDKCVEEIVELDPAILVPERIGEFSPVTGVVLIDRPQRGQPLFDSRRSLLAMLKTYAVERPEADLRMAFNEDVWVATIQE